jgi:hypothetical protein
MIMFALGFVACSFLVWLHSKDRLDDDDDG